MSDNEQVKALLSSSHETVKQLSVCSEATSLKVDDLAIRVVFVFDARQENQRAGARNSVAELKTRGNMETKTDMNKFELVILEIRKRVVDTTWILNVHNVHFRQSKLNEFDIIKCVQ